MSENIKMILSEQIRQVELEPTILVRRTTSINDAIEEMKLRSIRAVVVLEDVRPVGIFTQRDILRNLVLTDTDFCSPIECVMHKDPKTMTLDNTLQETIELLTSQHCRTLPIVNEHGRIVGVLTAQAIINHIASYFPTEVYNIPPNPYQTSSTKEGA